MLLIECNGCHTKMFSEEANVDPDAALTCADPEASGCCTDDHHHGDNQRVGEPCRPITITVMPGSVVVQHVAK